MPLSLYQKCKEDAYYERKAFGGKAPKVFGEGCFIQLQMPLLFARSDSSKYIGFNGATSEAPGAN